MKKSSVYALSVCMLLLSNAVLADYKIAIATDQGDAKLGPAAIIAKLRALRIKEGKSRDSEAILRTLPVALTVRSGQGELSLDARGVNVTSLSLSAGQGDVVLYLPEAGEITGKLETRQGKVQIIVPHTRAIGLDLVDAGQSDVVFGDVSQDVGIATSLSAKLAQGDVFFTDQLLSEKQLDALQEASQDE
jgi:hypothetical protein